MESLTMNTDKGIISIFNGGIWLALFRVWLLCSASGFMVMGGTLAARVNVKTMQIPYDGGEH